MQKQMVAPSRQQGVQCCLQGILIELPLAGFFLKKMRNPHSDINDLVTLDPELYRNLMSLRDYEGDFSDLALTFTTADNHVGHSREVKFHSMLSCIPVSFAHIPYRQPFVPFSCVFPNSSSLFVNLVLQPLNTGCA